MSSKVMKVSVLAHYLKSKLENDQYLNNIIVQGEISNFTNHKSGHWYFSIKDDTARLSCVMFKTYNTKTSFIPKDGDKVLIRCSTSLFESNGSLQLYVNAIKHDGIGDLYLQYEMLKKKLAAKGIFADEHKKPIPKYPERICVVTGNKTAALNDVITTIERRWPLATLSIYPVLVQGDMASKQIIEALQYVDKLNFDIILLVRGGGSIEDLWAFNNEELAYCIYNMQTCIISGVGHEVDTTIVDNVCDVRGATPTAAATLATPDINDVKAMLIQLSQRLNMAIDRYKQNKEVRLDYYQLKLNNIKYTVNDNAKKLDILNHKLLLAINSIKNKQENHLVNNLNKLKMITSDQILKNNNQINNYKITLLNNINNIYLKNNYHLMNNIKLLDAYSPLKIMQRGYSLTFKDDKLVNSIKDIVKNDNLMIKLQDGYINTIVKDVNKNE